MANIAEYRFRIHDLSRLDQTALTPQLKGANAQFEVPEVSRTGHNELMTIALVGGISILGTVAAYYFGKYKKKKLLLEVEVIDPKGGTKRIHLEVDETSVEPVDNQILKQLKDFIGAGN